MSTVYVGSAGSDSNTYAQAQVISTPWLTIGKANTSATTGDTIIILNGTLTWEAVAFTKSFTITGQTRGSAILDAGGLSKVCTLGTPLAYITYNDLVFKNNVIAGSNPMWHQGLQGIAISFNRCTFQDCTLSSNSGATGIVGQTNGTGGGTGPASVSFVSCVMDNVITGRLVKFTGWTYTGATFTFTNNTVYISSGTQTIYDVGGSSTTVTYKNNIIANFGTSITQWIVGGGIVTSTYNCNYLVTSAVAGTGNITSDPLFVDAANHNFALRPSSPCLETGTLI